jgi:hypothetical protein
VIEQVSEKMCEQVGGIVNATVTNMNKLGIVAECYIEIWVVAAV